MWDRLIYAFWAIRIFWPVGTFLQFTLFFQTPEKPLKRTFTSKGRVFTDSFKLGGIVNKRMSYAVLPRKPDMKALFNTARNPSFTVNFT